VENALERFFPRSVKANDGGIIFRLEDHRLRVLDKDYAPTPNGESFLSGYGPEGRLPESNVSKTAVTSLWLWQPVEPGEIVAFSDLSVPPASGTLGTSRERVGFVRFPVSDPENLRVLGEDRDGLPYDPNSLPCPASCDPGTVLRAFNRLGGYDYIAALGKTAFILRMDDLRIYRQVGDDNKLEPLAVNFAEVTQPGVERPPSLPRLLTKQDYTDAMARLELSTMPTGLYAWGDSLFVTTRIYDGKGTHWTITKIDPNTKKILGTASIPTAANHLTIAPGPERWAFIEKGPVEGWHQVQEIPSILFVRADKFERELKGDLCEDQ
jgi:hypothetical protein